MTHNHWYNPHTLQITKGSKREPRTNSPQAHIGWTVSIRHLATAQREGLSRPQR